MAQSRAVDDFRAIRARMEELRRERAQLSPERDIRPSGPRPYHAATHPSPNGGARPLARAIRQKLFGRISRAEPACGLLRKL
jgi:hypothetical protein